MRKHIQKNCERRVMLGLLKSYVGKVPNCGYSREKIQMTIEKLMNEVEEMYLMKDGLMMTLPVVMRKLPVTMKASKSDTCDNAHANRQIN